MNRETNNSAHPEMGDSDESLSRIPTSIPKNAPLNMEEAGKTCLPKLLSLRTDEVKGDKLHPRFAINQGLGSL